MIRPGLSLRQLVMDSLAPTAHFQDACPISIQAPERVTQKQTEFVPLMKYQYFALVDRKQAEIHRHLQAGSFAFGD
jgi:hypothetical protein